MESHSSSSICIACSTAREAALWGFRVRPGSCPLALSFRPLDGIDAMLEEMSSREYVRDDLEAMVELDAECFAPPFRFNRVTMRKFAEAKNAWVRVAENDGEMAGFCIVHREKAAMEEFGYVVTIDVTKRFRGQGVGEWLLTEAEEWVRSWKGSGMLLHVFTGNHTAVRFYERMQYRKMELLRGFYGPGLDAEAYWKEFGDT